MRSIKRARFSEGVGADPAVDEELFDEELLDAGFGAMPKVHDAKNASYKLTDSLVRA